MGEEFYAALALYGGISFAGLLIVVVLTLIGLAYKNRVTEKKVIKELYGKERKNGQHKGGARGKF